MSGRIRVEKRGRIGWLVFDHPERRNAISVDLWSAIPQAVQELAGDDEVRVVVLRGAGETAFVSGADISEFESLRTGGVAADYDRESVRAVGALLQLEKPVLAMIHGFCLGGGVAVSLAADLRYAAEDAVFAIPAAHRDALSAEIEQALASADVAHWVGVLNEAGVPSGPVLDLEQVFADPQVLAREMLVEMPHPELGTFKTTGLPVKLSMTPGRIARRPPLHGEHTEEVLRGCGLAAHEIEQLREDGVI